ncbi:MAG: cupin domain-containing protein [Candidatus Poribacteria bacterium]|nr:cupin domain-containing protein [Candidatus Poribacteria bacterium]
MKQLFHEDLYSWSTFSEARQLDFNSHLWVRQNGSEVGNVVIDPLPLSDGDRRQLDALGGAAFIVITNRDHEREAGALRDTTGAQIVVHEDDAPLLSVKVDRTVRDGDEIVPWLSVIHLRHGKSPGEIMLHLRDKGVMIGGDLVVGAPMGRLSLIADDKLENPPAAALELRKALRHWFDVLLVGDGASIFTNARERLVECLEARTDIYLNKIHPDELEWTPRMRHGNFECDVKEFDALIGARNLGYRLIRVPPGKKMFPFHSHTIDEEFFYVVEGECVLRTRNGETRVRQGEFIAFPPGPTGVHQFRNESNAPCVFLALANIDPTGGDYCDQPDSGKLVGPHGVYRKRDQVPYLDGE